MPPSSSQPASIDAYIAGYPDQVQAILQRIRAIIQEEAPDAKETIKYGMPTFTYYGNLVHFGAFTHHIGFYPIPSGIEAFKSELTPYKQGKGSIQFRLDEPIPYDLIRKMVAFRVQENAAKGKKK